MTERRGGVERELVVSREALHEARRREQAIAPLPELGDGEHLLALVHAVADHRHAQVVRGSVVPVDHEMHTTTASPSAAAVATNSRRSVNAAMR